MSIFRFDAKDSQFGIADGTEVTMTLPLSVCNPRTPTVIGNTTTAMSGMVGATRIRGWKYEGEMTLPDIPWAMLPSMIDFAEAMKYGYSNPFFFDGTDMFGHYRTFYAVVTNEKIELPNRFCKAWTASFSYRETLQ